ncbi:unnamed protein product [Enterobius vermicularis]|uniref:Conjugal transfer protein TrbD n=1 Tax=Enterobius vermicularis TaxID=51028 RepID=A0A0N4VR44_ENTVE|nr:unnamed protein product [Enterobius vermicularis]
MSMMVITMGDDDSVTMKEEAMVMAMATVVAVTVAVPLIWMMMTMTMPLAMAMAMTMTMAMAMAIVVGVLLKFIDPRNHQRLYPFIANLVAYAQHFAKPPPRHI